jgi:hypothetical protein
MHRPMYVARLDALQAAKGLFITLEEGERSDAGLSFPMSWLIS